MPEFKFTEAQQNALELCAGPQVHTMLFGGSRSGKTFLFVRNIVLRALKSPVSRHVLFRFRGVDAKQKVMLDTFPKVMKLCFPDVRYRENKSECYATFQNRSEFWFSGLDDKERVDKVLGGEYATVYFNEASQISNDSRKTALTRLAQKTYQTIDGVTVEMPLRAYYDCNPPSKAHWTYRMFVAKKDPETGRLPLKRPDNYELMKINPIDNADNLPEAYLNELQDAHPIHRKRFWEGEFSEAIENQLIPLSTIDAWRVTDGEPPDFTRIVIGVDPSGHDGTFDSKSDAIGIVVVALGTDGVAYVLEDNTVSKGPEVWGQTVATTFERLPGDLVVVEKNFGGDMAMFVIRSANSDIPIKPVSASRGKTVRAEPIASLYHKGKIRHVGYFPDLESELELFSSEGYKGDKSPNRADSLIWCAYELFPGLTKPVEDEEMQVEELTEWAM